MILNFRRMSSNIQRCRAAIRNHVGCCRDCVAGIVLPGLLGYLKQHLRYRSLFYGLGGGEG